MRELRYKLIPHFNPNLASNCLKHVLQKPHPLWWYQWIKPHLHTWRAQRFVAPPLALAQPMAAHSVWQTGVLQPAAAVIGWCQSQRAGTFLTLTHHSQTDHWLSTTSVKNTNKYHKSFMTKIYSKVLKQWYALYVLLHSYKEHESCRWYEMYSNFFNSLWSNSVINLGQHWFR